MKVLVTGGTGLIGCHAAAALLEGGHEVRLFVRDAGKVDRVLAPFGYGIADVEIVEGDLTEGEGGVGEKESGSARGARGQAAIREALSDCDGLLHCAGVFSPLISDEAWLKQVNVEGTRNALGAGVEAGVSRIVHVSSMLALFPPGGPVMKATDPVAQPRSMYAQTKASAERIARAFQESAPLTILYPAAVHGPNDPTFSMGPQLVARALAEESALVTEGGLAYSDVRDLARVIGAIFDGEDHSDRLLAPSFFVTHERYRMLLELVTGREIGAQKMPGFMLRALGRFGDLAQKFGRSPALNYEAAEVLTRSVPLDDRESVALLGRPKLSDEESFRDLVGWMVRAGHLSPELAGSAAAESDAR